MPQYQINVPGQGTFRVNSPTDLTDEQVWAAVQSQLTAPAPPEPAKKEGFGAALGKGLEGLISPLRTATGAITGSPEEAALAGIKRAEESPYADQVSLEKVKQAYERGLLPAAGEVLRQIPLAITEQLPNIAATLGSARLGAMAGAGVGSVVPGIGTAVGGIGGGILGAVAPSLLQQFGGNIQRQAQEQLEAKQPVDISRTAAISAAVPQAALDVAATFIPLGRSVAGSVLGPQVKELLEKGAKESAEKLARESLPTVLAKGAGISIASEAPTEALQSMLERAQAGLPLLSEDALKEYGEAAYQAALIAPIGSAARVGERSVARDQPLAEGMLPGETERQAAERLQAEILAMKEAAKPPAPGPILDTNNLYTLMAQPTGYALVEQYKQRLAELPETEETKAAIEEASFIQRRSIIEGLERQPTKAVLTDKTLKQMGFKPDDGVYESLLGKDMASPDQAEEITQALSSAKAQEDLSPALVGRIDSAINVVNDLQQRIYPKAKEDVEQKAPAAPPAPPAPSPVLDTNNLYTLMAQPNGYALVEQYKQRLAQLPQSQEIKSAIDEASFIQRRSVIESIGRQPTTAVLNDRALKNSGFKPKDGVYEALLGKDIANPDEADTVNQSLTAIKAQEGVSPALAGKIDNFLVTLNEFQDSIYPRGKDAGQAITPPSGERVSVAGEPGAGVSAERPAAPVPGGVVPAVEDVRQPAGREEAAAPAVEPEVVTVPTTTRDAVEQHAVKGLPIIPVPLDQLTISKDVPQFKSEADERGIVKPLQGKFDTTGVAPIQLWRRTDGRLEVISGRHRFDLAQRSGETTIPAQIHDEAAGFDAAKAATLDAELNIRDEQGEVKDYVVYFEKSGISEEDARSKGFLGRTVGQRGWTIASQGSPDLIAAHRAGIVPDDAAAGIAAIAPKDSRLQAVGIKAVRDNKSTPAVLNTVQAVKALATERGAPQEEAGDLFGFDDSAIKEAEEMARIATDKQREIGGRLAAITGAANKPAVAKAEGIDIKDEAALNKRIQELRQARAAWNNWSSNPTLVKEIRDEMTKPAAPAPAVAPAVTPAAAAPAAPPVKMKIVKTEVSTTDGKGTRGAWNVVDADDGYVFDTFNTRNEAQEYVNKAKEQKEPLVEAAEPTAPTQPETPSQPEQTLLVEATNNLSQKEQSALESHYGGPLDSAEVQGKVLNDVLAYINKGAKSVAESVRKIIGKLSKALLSVAVFFTTSGINPQINTEAYARTVASMPAQVAVTKAEQQESKRADTAGRKLSPNAQRVADWIANNADVDEVSQIVDPATGMMYVMKGGTIVADSPVLFGKAGIGAIDAQIIGKPIAEMTDADKVTPAGRFALKLEKDETYGTTLTFLPTNDGGGYAIHRVYLGNPSERRAERLNSQDATDNSVSYGCVNVSNEFYDQTLKQFDYSGKAFAYLLPSDASKLNEFFDFSGKGPKGDLVSKKSLVEMRKRYEAGRAAEPAAPTPPEPTELDKQIQAKTEELGRVLSRIMGRFGLKDVALNLVEDMKAEGEYSQSVIRLALDAVSPVQALRHESIHALKELGFFTPQQWSALERQAKSKWVDQYLKNVNINKEPLGEGEKSRYDAYMDLYQGDMDAIIEEAIADAFGDFDVNKAPPGLMQAILNRLRNFFDAIKTAFGGEVTAEQVFRKVERGELGKVTAAGSQSITKESLRVMRGEEVPNLGKKVTVDMVGKYFDDQFIKEFGGKLDYNNPQHFDRAVQQATEEVQYQIKNDKSGLDWYEEDIQKAFKDTAKILPELKNKESRILFSVIAGIMSPQTIARDNWFIAAKAFEHYVKTGDIPGNNPENGNLWMGGTQAPNKKVQLEFLDKMVKDLGQKNAIKWLMTPHPVKEINEFRSKYGNIKSGIDGKATDIKPGLYAFGPKIGPFVSNINGIHDVTVDKWFTRTFNRYFGTMIGPDGKIIDAPTEPQRRFIKELANKVAEDAGIKNYQVQSLLWFYEQRLFTELGAQSPSYGFSDGAVKFLESRGKGGGAGVAVPAGPTGAGKVKPSLRAPQTEAFKKWSGGAPVVGLRQDHVFVSGKPVVAEALHGTTNADITEFKKSKANIESDFGAGFYASNTPADVAINYANVEGADLTRRIETLAERIADNEEFEGDMDAAMEEARKRLSQGAPNTMKLYMLFKNPAVLGGKGETFFDYNQSYNEETDEYGEPTGSLVDFVNQLDEIGEGLDISMRDVERAKQDLIEAGRDNEGLKFSELAQIVKDRFSDTYDLEGGSAANGEVLRQALEGMGFDGVIDTNAYAKFGPRMIRGAYSMIKTEGMAGLDKDTVHFVAFKPTQIKSATGNIGTFDAKKPDIRYSLRDSIGLYSELENKVAQGPNKAPAASWKAYINGLTQKGVKPEEIEWSGVRDWLDLQTGPVSKDAVNAYLKQGGVKVEEVVLGESMPGRDLDRWLDRWADKNPGTATARAINQGLSWNEIAEVAKADNQPVVRRLLESQETPAKYGQYVLPGGKNYREVLLTLPSKQERDFMWEWFDPRTQESRQFATRDAALLDKPIGAVVQKVQTAERNKDFKSSHWDQPNVLAHIRLNDRTDADGNKVLFVEEIQSDWGQEGKKKGFVGDLIPQDTNWQAVDTLDTVSTRAEAEAKLEELQPFLERNREPGMESRLVIREGDGFFDIVEESRSPTATAPRRYGVPRGPFVTKTEGWLNLALKRIMVMAAEGGYDKVAFSDAEPHFKRWGTERIDWSKQPDGSFLVRAKSQEGGEAAGINLEAEAVARGLSKTNSKTVNSVKDLEDTIRPALTEGQKAEDLAPKIWERMQAENTGTAMPRREGFEAFYGDKRGMNPKTGAPSFLLGSLKKLLPKVGGGQAETVEIESTKGNAGELKWFSRIPPGAARVIQRAPNVFQVLAKDERSGVEQVRGGNFNTREAAEQYIADNTAGITQDQTGFTVTPEMKQKVETTGLPRFSLRASVPRDIHNRIVQTTVAREEQGFAQRITEAISPQSFSSFRAAALNRYNQLGVYDKILAKTMGGVKLLANVSAEAAALLSDLGAGLTASALGVHDRMGGIPVYRNGITTISNLKNTVKGPTAIFAPLAKYGDPYAYQTYQYWAGVKRGSRFMADGREQLFEPADIPRAEALRKQFLKDGVDFEAIQKDWIKYNNGLVDYMVDTGVLSKERADLYKKHSDYLPFYRQMDGETTVGPKIFQAISGVKPPKKLKGGEAPIDDFLENIVRNTQAAIQAGVKNVAAQRAADVAVKIQMADRLDYQSSAPNTFQVLEKGKVVTYSSQDMLFINAIKSLGLPDLPFIGFLSGPANLLRNLVTKDPGFMLANLMRDSMSAWVTSGVKMTPLVDTISNFGSAIAGKNPAFQALMNAGILGGYEFSQNVEQSGREFAAALRKQAGVRAPGYKGLLELGAKPFTSLWEALEKGSTASDAATRMEVYKKTLAETGNEAEALYRALEVMNFNRKGSSAVIRVLTAAVPFLNARMQGLDVLYRAATGKIVGPKAAEIQKQFFVRGATIAAISAAYWLLTHDDEEYKKQEQETRDNYWLLPSLGIKIPIPFEIGVLFKVIPERILAYTFGSDTGEDFIKSMARQLTSTLAFNPIPQTVLPVVESMTNFSFFTMRPIVGQGLEGLQPAYQVGPGTSRLSELVGDATKGMAKELQISPMKLDQLISGYTGTMGMYLVNLMDAVYNMNTDSPKPSMRFERLPVIRRFALDPEARGAVTGYYELKNSVDSIVRTSNMLERTMNYEELPEYLQDNMQMLAVKDYLLDLEKTMKEFREMKIIIRSSQMEADVKRDAILSIDQMENQLTSNIQYLKSLAKGG